MEKINLNDEMDRIHKRFRTKSSKIIPEQKEDNDDSYDIAKIKEQEKHIEDDSGSSYEGDLNQLV